MGIRCQRASQRPLAGSDCLPDRTFHRCALAELIVYSGHCTGVLLQKESDANLKGSLLALTGSMVLVAAVLYGIVPGVVKVGGWFELLFVNSFGMPFNSGLIVYIILLAASIIWGVYESYTEKSRKRMNISFMVTIAMLGIPFYGYGWSSALIGIIILGILGVYLFADLNKKYQISARTLNTSLLCIMMIMVGYSHTP